MEGFLDEKVAGLRYVDESLSNCDTTVGYWLPNTHIYPEPKKATLFGGNILEDFEEARRDSLLGPLERSQLLTVRLCCCKRSSM